MRKSICLVLFILIILTDCTLKQTSGEIIEKLDNNTDQIIISPLHMAIDPINLTKKDEISTIVNYINLIKYNNGKNESLKGNVGSYLIEIKSKNNNIRTFQLNQDLIFSEKGKNNFKIQYNQAINFGNIIADILQKKQIDKHKLLLKGTVVGKEVTFNNSQGTLLIEDENKELQKIDLSKSIIMNSNGKENIKLDKDDIINIYYKGQRRNAAIIADSVFIVNKK
ncbi:MAG: hypothetical protein RSB00_04445 [Bacilli bacterium]